jgi:NAD(P)-dependent dehydrogenase (short-subunit alcohol dehydrogenase family)
MSTQPATPTVFVTGAAAGIGRATVRRFAAAGYRVGAYDVDAEGLASLAAELPSAPSSQVVTGVLDVRDADAWASALAQFCGPDGTLDILVNNAGVLDGGPFSEIPLAAHRRTVEVNVLGVVNGCHTAHRYLRSGSHVVNLASASAIYGQAELATYSATKFAVRGLTEALDLEWGSEGITVTALWPLFVETKMTDGLDIGTTRALGIRLSADDVADEVFAAATSGQGLLRSPHRPVGAQAKALFAASSISPSWLSRLVNRRLAAR